MVGYGLRSACGGIYVFVFVFVILCVCLCLCLYVCVWIRACSACVYAVCVYVSVCVPMICVDGYGCDLSCACVRVNWCLVAFSCL